MLQEMSHVLATELAQVNLRQLQEVVVLWQDAQDPAQGNVNQIGQGVRVASASSSTPKRMS